MLQDNPQTVPQADLMAIDALFRRIAERGRKIRAQAQENSIQTQSTVLSTGQVNTDKKATQEQSGK